MVNGWRERWMEGSKGGIKDGEGRSDGRKEGEGKMERDEQIVVLRFLFHSYLWCGRLDS